MPDARSGSWKRVLQLMEGDRLPLPHGGEERGEVVGPRAHRAIGGFYDLSHERYSNHVPTVLPRRYDVFVYLDETRALKPLRDHGEVPET